MDPQPPGSLGMRNFLQSRPGPVVSSANALPNACWRFFLLGVFAQVRGETNALRTPANALRTLDLGDVEYWLT